MENYFIIAFFIGFGTLMLFNRARYHRKGNTLFGMPPINARLFIFGKVAMMITWGFFILQALTLDLAILSVPEELSWIAAIIGCIGISWAVLAILQLRSAAKFGLSAESEQLHTSGIYRISRNPMYIGFILLDLGSCMYCPNPINIGFAIAAIVIHHKIIVAEEADLRQKFTAAWDRYAQEVGRYL
jgi:protein-S-isoprenylcysteine O-methyltransferase Ste14